jgi:hypothetical protein
LDRFLGVKVLIVFVREVAALQIAQAGSVVLNIIVEINNFFNYKNFIGVKEGL